MASFGTMEVEVGCPQVRRIGGIPFDTTGRTAKLRVYDEDSHVLLFSVVCTPLDPTLKAFDVPLTAGQLAKATMFTAEFQVYESDGVTAVVNGKWHGRIIVSGMSAAASGASLDGGAPETKFGGGADGGGV